MNGAEISWLAQYPLRLPADYQMEIIRRRVRERGSALDQREGLGLKFYAIREATQHGSTVNEYAPFYFWRQAQAMADFHWRGGGFQGIIKDFGRPAVHSWLPATISGFEHFPECSADHPLYLTLRSSELSAEQELGSQVAQLVELTENRHTATEALGSALGVNTERWQSLQLALYHDVPEPETGDILYTVLHVSAPL
ncbi:DUF4865 family protein [Psychromicrobium lacuslunae]|uniref:DUF4865 domain-containing protein n=1 Tax=Psychromicrobium lacuslunae TaxID=1618207 RepID=A0A0D4BW22_9MICC|nr:DUF4865 family protein [Psychromicrobium lacuslunae]AJT40503.1 hypothetical protein UM93_01220 [Psychromicrobium lacuslunae]